MFTDRAQAGRILGKRIKEELFTKPEVRRLPCLTVGLPRGGVPVAYEIAECVNAPLTVLVCKKIGAPYQPEFAIGAVASTGSVVLNESIGSPNWHIARYIEDQVALLTESTRKAEDEWLRAAGLPGQVDFKGKLVILADDGIATGMTTLAALRSVRKLGAASVILATPVIAKDTFEKLKTECNALIALLVPEEFGAVGFFYRDFHQVEDREVLHLLKKAWSNPARNAGSS